MNAAEQAAVHLIEVALPSYAHRFLAGPSSARRLDVDHIYGATERLSSGEQVIVDLAVELWQGRGVLGYVGSRLDEGNRKHVLDALGMAWLRVSGA